MQREPFELPQSVKDNIKSAYFIIEDDNNTYIELEYQEDMSYEDKKMLHGFIHQSFIESLSLTDDKHIHEVFDNIEFRMK